MTPFNPRVAIHNAFAIHMGTPDGVGGGTKFDSDAAIYMAMKAGMVISATMNQPKPARACAIYLNAHDGVLSESDLCAMKAWLWQKFLKRSHADNRTQAEVMAVADYLIMGHKNRVWNHESLKLRPHAIARLIVQSDAAISRVVENCNIYLDCLTQLDNTSLQPVIRLIAEQKERYENAKNNQAAG